MADDHLIDFERAGRITASIVSAILRLDPSHSRKWAWRVVTGREPERDSADMQRGREYEANAIASLECELGCFCDPGGFVPHPTLSWLGASPDARIDSNRVPVEAKCPRILHGEIPAKYYAQLQTQIECCDAPYGYFASWVNDTPDGFWYLKVQRDAAWWANAKIELDHFYTEYILTDTEPPRAPRRVK